jgi:hypothetical protein
MHSDSDRLRESGFLPCYAGPRSSQSLLIDPWNSCQDHLESECFGVWNDSCNLGRPIPSSTFSFSVVFSYPFPKPSGTTFRPVFLHSLWCSLCTSFHAVLLYPHFSSLHLHLQLRISSFLRNKQPSNLCKAQQGCVWVRLFCRFLDRRVGGRCTSSCARSRCTYLGYEALVAALRISGGFDVMF